MTDRKKVPIEIETEVLIKSRRRCCLCFGMDGDLEEKRGQIAHVDRDRNNNSLDNLAFLCFKHHDIYDSTSSQSKNYTKNEVKSYRGKLYGYFDKLYSSKYSTSDYYKYLNESIQIKSDDYQMQDNSIIIEVDDIKMMKPHLVNIELWNTGELELMINKIEMRNRLPFHFSSEYWLPLRFKGSDKSNTFEFIRYIYKHFIKFEIEGKKYIDLFYYFPQMRIDFVKKIYSLQFDFLIDVTIPSKSFNYEIPDVTREVTKTIFFDFKQKP